MPRNSLKRYLPSPAEIREYRALQPIAHLFADGEIWHFNRRAASGAVFIGLFCAFLPIPMQMLLAAILAVAFRYNLPISVVLVWITNPLTIPPIFYFAYRLGAWLLDIQIQTQGIRFELDWLLDNLRLIGVPLLFGSLVCAWISGVTGFVITRILWRLRVVRRWRRRRGNRQRL